METVGINHLHSLVPPTETLERQNQAAAFPRVHLFVKANTACCMYGGIESLLQAKNVSNGSANGAPSQTLSESVSDTTSSTAAGSAAADPFSFLESDASAQQQQETESKKKGPNLGRFLKKVAQTTTQSLERGMHHLAVRADQGRTPDQLVVALYQGETAISLTETVSLPPETARFEGLRFCMPLVLPKSVAATSATAANVSLKLWVKSGASLLNQKAIGKYYLLGTARLLPVDGSQVVFSNLELQSTVIVGGKLQVVATPDRKLPPLCGRGWSMADPALAGVVAGRFNPTLDQSYGFSLNKNLLVATERATESTLVLPVAVACAQLCARASHVSMLHLQAATAKAWARRFDAPVGEHAATTVQVGTIQASILPPFLKGCTPIVTVALEAPDCVFAVDLMGPGVQTQVYGKAPPVFEPVTSFVCYPKPCRNVATILPGLLTNGQLPANGYLLGCLVVQVHWTKAGGGGGTTAEHVWTSRLALEPLVGRPPAPMSVPLQDAQGSPLGTLGMQVNVQLIQATNAVDTGPSPKDGLVSLMSLGPLVEHVVPAVDYEANAVPPQVAGSGPFLSHAYLDHHKALRAHDAQVFAQRVPAYGASLALTAPAQRLAPHEDRAPRAFRPSSSRPEVTLAGIPFNVHTSTLALDVLAEENVTTAATTEPPIGSVFYNVTCGCPSDHARGFGNVLKRESDAPLAVPASPIGPVTGGLRRLEAKRTELARLLQTLQANLTQAVAAHQGETKSLYVPARHVALQTLRSKVFEAAQALHHLTWLCAVRRANVFSQALGVAVTCFLASLSDPQKWQSTWPSVWLQHGYLVSFEGLLSAAGKELGMIEDASVGIGMLEKVRMAVTVDDGKTGVEGRVPVAYSPYLKWMQLSTTGHYEQTEYLLTIGLVPSYFEQRVPPALKQPGVAGIRMVPLLFEVGVDIRQWGAHAGSNMTKTLHTQGSGSILDDDEDTSNNDEGGDIVAQDQDDDVLVQLNTEAFQKMNAYSHAISPVPGVNKTSIHPQLETLHQHIAGSAGKINHDIVVEAAYWAQQLGGGCAVFCKSGKDRTAMHETYKQAQYCHFYRKSPVDASLLEHATLMRVHGTRLAVCEKNVGQAKYAFNSLQLKFMPEALRPPVSTLAGFLKGGKVFQGGGIES